MPYQCPIHEYTLALKYLSVDFLGRDTATKDIWKIIWNIIHDGAAYGADMAHLIKEENSNSYPFDSCSKTFFVLVF